MTDRIARRIVLDGGSFDTIAPFVEYASAVSAHVIEVGFGTAMKRSPILDATTVLNPANYSIPGLTVVAAVDTTPTRVRLTVTEEMTQGVAYTVTVAATLLSYAGDTIDGTRVSMAFAGLGDPPTISRVESALVAAGTNVRVVFSEPMTSNAALIDTANYVFAATGGAAVLTPSAVTPEAVGSPTYVDITVNPMTDGGSYTVAVSSVSDAVGNAIVASSLAAFVGYQDVIQPQVLAAVPQSNTVVRVQFSEAMVSDANLITPDLYYVSGGLQVVGVTRVDATHVDLATSSQVGNKSYTLTVSTVIKDTLGNGIDPVFNTTTFLGQAAPDSTYVADLLAVTHPNGLRVDLSWTNPSGVTGNKILRKTRAYPFSSADGYVVYDGAAITSLSDTDQLLGDQFYYYAVLASIDGGTTYALSASESVREVLSIRVVDSYTWLWNQIPGWHRKKQEAITDGSGLLSKVVDTLAAGMNLLRGELYAYNKSSDPDAATVRLLSAWNRAFDFAPEVAVDISVMRRVVAHIVEIYKRKGTIPALVQLVEVMTGWGCVIVEFGVGGTVFKTWDGSSTRAGGGGNSAALTVQRELVADGSKAFASDEWLGGILIDGMGNICDIAGNTATNIALEAKTVPACVLTGTALAGQKVLPVNRTAGLQPQQHILISDGANHQVAYIKSVIVDTSITVQEDLAYTFLVATEVFDGTDIIDAEIVGTGVQVTAGGFDGLQDTAKQWVTNQWKGYKLLDSANTQFTVESNTVNAIYVTTGTPAAGSYSISVDHTLGASFALRDPHYRYSALQGDHYLLFEPTFGLALVGTATDPFDRLYAGASGVSLGFTDDDFAVFIDAGVAAVVGRATGVSLNVLTNSTATYTVNALAGLHVNPNRQQKRLFEVVSNTATTITFNQSIEGIAGVGDFYFGLNEKNMIKYQRLVAVLPKFYSRATRGFTFFE